MPTLNYNFFRKHKTNNNLLILKFVYNNSFYIRC